MTVVPYKAEHLLALQVQPGQLGTAGFITPEYARALEDENAFTLLVDGQALAVGGVKEIWPGRAFVWSWIDRRAGAHFAAVHHAAKQILAAAPYRRIEADVPCGFTAGHRWLRLLGFHLEAACMMAYQPDGADCSLYARVK